MIDENRMKVPILTLPSIILAALKKDEIPAAPHQYEWRVATLIVALICAIWISRTVVVVVALCVGGCRSFLSCL